MDTKLQFKLEVYEGPLDLLLTLIDKNKINIYDIPISFIFEQYMNYIDEMEKMDMEIAGEFINMSAELMLIKSKMLLPKSEEEEDDPRLQLVATLIEYKLIKEAAIYFGEQYTTFSGRMTKEQTILEHDITIQAQDISLLRQAFVRIYKRLEDAEKSETEPKQQVNKIISSKIISVQEKIVNIIRYMYHLESCKFVTLLERSETRSDLIATFAAILELLRTHRLIIIKNDETNPNFILNKERKPREI